MTAPTHSTAGPASPGTPQQVCGVRSIGVALKGARLARFLDGEVRFTFLPPGLAPGPGIDALAGWGLKGTARDEARRRGLPYLALEDGFLRTAGLGGKRDPSLSLTADWTGVHYDASFPSDLERTIAAAAVDLTPAEAEDARRLMTLMREANLGKFNAAPDAAADDPLFAGGPLVLVVDQIAGDQSIAGGGCSASTFAEMLDAAVAENPGARVVARVHPFDGVGGRRGHLKPLAKARGLEVYDADVSWMSIARRAARVYVATSHAGLEALIAGAPVTCFGLPAYAGWGLTDDRQSCPRRDARPGLDALVAAIYLRYSRYLSPLDGAPCAALEVARLLAARRRLDAETEGVSHVVGVQRWKRYHSRPFLQGRRSTLTWSLSPKVALERQRRLGGRIVIWSSREQAGFAQDCRDQGAPLVRMEDGFLRSVGLGANLEPPSSLVLDRSGIYYDPSGCSDLEALLQRTQFDEPLKRRAAQLRGLITAARLSKYNVGAGGLEDLAERAGTRLRVLVPAQVADDASVLRGGGEIGGNLALLQAVREARPDAFIVFKPHPDVEAGIRPGAVAEDVAMRHADMVAHRRSIAELLDQVDEVHTLTSLAGFEALLKGRRVSTYGMPFYAGWGLTADRMSCPRRTRRLDLDELAAGVLILYPRYVDRSSGWPCEAEDVVRSLAFSVHGVDTAGLLNKRRGRTLTRYIGQLLG